MNHTLQPDHSALEFRFTLSDVPEMPRQSSDIEARQRPISASTQYDLFDTIATSTAECLSEVSTLSVRITLDNPTHADAEKRKILAALRTVPNVRSLALLKPVEASHGAGGNAHLRLYDAVLRQLPALYPQLDALAVDTDDHALGFLRGLRRLRRLHFSGRARASPMEALAVLGQLRCLEELEVTATAAASAEGDAGARAAPRRCLTREVLRGLGGGGSGRLRVLMVREGRADGGTERGRAGPRVAPGFVDAAMMRAVGAAFRVRRVAVVWSGNVLPIGALDALPASVEELRLEVWECEV